MPLMDGGSSVKLVGMGGKKIGVFRKNRDFVFRSIAGETILVPIRRQVADLRSIYVFNPTAAEIWKMVDGRRTAREIARTLVSDYEVEPRRATQDVEDFLDKLSSVGAIRVL